MWVRLHSFSDSHSAVYRWITGLPGVAADRAQCSTRGWGHILQHTTGKAAPFYFNCLRLHGNFLSNTLDNLSNKAENNRQAWVFAGHFVGRCKSLLSDIFKNRQTLPTDFRKPVIVCMHIYWVGNMIEDRSVYRVESKCSRFATT